MKTKQAFQIKASIENQSWETKGTVLIAANESEAIEKAKNILKLKPEHKIQANEIEVFSTDSKLSTDSYPYGRLKCTAYFSVESTKNGFRSVFQTVNPKNGVLNKEKKSTYYSVMLQTKDSGGYISTCGHNQFNGDEEINRGLQFMNDFFELFTVEQIKTIALSMLSSMQINSKAQVIYCGTKWEDLKPLVKNQIKECVKIAKTGENLFLNCLLDIDKIKALKLPNYNPFQVKSYEVA